MPAVGITDGPPPCVRYHQAVVLLCSHLACRRWVALERRSYWLVVDTQVKACSRETHSPSRTSKTHGQNTFQIIHTHHCYQQWSRTHYSTPQSPNRLRNDLKCVEWDVKPCSIQSTSLPVLHEQTPMGNAPSSYLDPPMQGAGK